MIIVFAVLCAIASPSRLLPAQSFPPMSEFQTRRFGLEAGLPSASVTGLAQTNNGFLYVAGVRGIARYNGQRFEAVGLPGLRSHRIFDLYRDVAERVWFRTGDNEIGFLLHGRLRALPAPPVFIGNSAEFTETADSLIWIGTDAGLLRIDPRKPSAPYVLLTVRDGLPSDTVIGVYDWTASHHVVATRRGFRLIGSGPSAAAVRIEGAAVAADIPGAYARRGARRDSRGLLLYVPGEAGAVLFDGHAARHLRGPAIQHLGGLSLDSTRSSRGGDALVLFDNVPGATYGVFAVPQVNGKWLVFHAQSPGRRGDVRQWSATHTDTLRLSIDEVQAALRDHEGSVWVGTSEGLYQVTRSRLQFARAADDSLLDFTTALLEQRNGELWVGTWTHGLLRYGMAGRQQYTGFDARYGDRVRALFEATDGAVWVGLVRGYARIVDGRVVSRAQTEESGQVTAFAETRDGTVWIGSRHALYAYRRGTTREHQHGAWVGRHIWSMHASANDVLWVGTEHGLARVSGDTHATVEWLPALQGEHVVSMHEEPDGTLWFGTYEHGVVRLKSGRFTWLSSADGMLNDAIWSLIDDQKGGLWMSGERGLRRVALRQLNAVADDREQARRSARVTGVQYSEIDGMPSIEANRASPAGVRLRDGRLMFNNRRGLVAADPATALTSPPAGTAIIDRVTADGDSTNLLAGSLATIAPGAQRVTFIFAATSFVAPTQLRFRYRLDPFDRGWTDSDGHSSATYTRLSPGQYTLRVESGRGDSVVWSANGDSIALMVRPTLWQSPWWRSFVLATTGLLVWLAYRYRIRKLMEVERLRLRIASDLHDDIGASLGSIALMTEMMAQDVAGHSTSSAMAERVRNAAAEASAALRDVIWVVDPTHRQLDDLARRIVSVAGAQLPGLSVRFDILRPLPDAQVPMPVMRAVLLISKEALHNVAKHAQATEAVVAIRVDDGILTLSIEDNGRGLSPASDRRGFGLASMRRRAALVGGSCEICASPMGGVRVLLCVDLRAIPLPMTAG